MSEVVKRLRERRANVWEQAKALADRSRREPRVQRRGAVPVGHPQRRAGRARQAREGSLIEGEQRAKDTEDAYAKLEGQPKVSGRGGARQRGARGCSGPRDAAGEAGAPRGIEVKPNGRSTSVPCPS
jgi:hypothetical protein